MEKNENQSNVQTLLSVLINKMVFIILIGIAAALVFALVTVFLITPQYSSTAKFYVNNTTENTPGISQQDINASKSLAETAIVIIKNDNAMLGRIIESADVDITVPKLKRMISAGTYSGTEAFYIKISSDSPDDALALANAFQELVPNVIPDVIKVGGIKNFDSPIKAVEPDSPSIVLNTVIGAFLGIAVSFLVFFLREVLDNTIYVEEDIKDRFGYPIIGAIPTITVNTPEAASAKRRKKNVAEEGGK